MRKALGSQVKVGRDHDASRVATTGRRKRRQDARYVGQSEPLQVAPSPTTSCAPMDDIATEALSKLQNSTHAARRLVWWSCRPFAQDVRGTIVPSKLTLSKNMCKVSRRGISIHSAALTSQEKYIYSHLFVHRRQGTWLSLFRVEQA